MKSAPIPADELARLEALRGYSLLDTLPEDIYDDITQLASEICRVPISLISLVDENRQWFKSKKRLVPDVDETERDYSFCAHAILNPSEILIVPDAREDARFTGNPAITGPSKVVFYAGVPLVNPEGYPLGTLCVIDNRPRTLTENQLLSLQALARLVNTHFELRKTKLELEATQARLTAADSGASAERLVSRLQPLVQVMQDKVERLVNQAPRPDQFDTLTALQQAATSLNEALSDPGLDRP
ncbi:GAF domain-containing protein [Spirosoma spitsbergense]|uniref:GAF domain-containing protein n=1 Tax=Spirosoma spitsbergense TaxID=431554 RepID=UPI000361B612|nr:GAF domain-containing protein [Spirosoma spitsbergense]